MRVAIVSTDIYPARGGVELHVYNLARSLAERGDSVFVYLGNGHTGRSHNGYFWVVTGVTPLQLHRLLNQDQIEVVHGQGARNVLVSSSLVIAHRKRLRTVFTPHCFYPPRNLAGWFKRLAFDNTLGKWALDKSDVIICGTENDRHDALALGALADRISIIPNSIRLPEPLPSERIAEWKATHGLDRFLLSVGRLDPVKRGDFLIQSLPSLPDDLRLVFVGPDWGCRQVWESLASREGVRSRVIFLGDVSNEELRAAYQACTLFVLASRYEGLPTVVLEAMAQGAPVLSSDAAGMRHVLQHGKTGFLYPYDDKEAFCQQVQLCLESDLSPVVRAAQEQVRRLYTWDVNADRIRVLYANGRRVPGPEDMRNTDV